MTNFFNKDEKELHFEQLKQKALVTGAKNAYEQFINECREKNYSKDVVLEKHHIVPRHAGGTDEPSNIINLSIKDHIFAHWLLWQLFDSVGDKRAYEFRVSIPAERAELQRKFIMENVAKYEKEGLFRFSSAYQSEMGKKGGSKGGSKNTPAQFEARQKVCEYTLWQYRGCKKGDNLYESLKVKGKTICPSGEPPITFEVIIQPKTAFIDLAKALEIFAPGSINLKNVATMHKLLQEPGQGRSIYGWKFIKTLTRSEVEVGTITDSGLTVYFEDAVFD